MYCSMQQTTTIIMSYGNFNDANCSLVYWSLVLKFAVCPVPYLASLAHNGAATQQLTRRQLDSLALEERSERDPRVLSRRHSHRHRPCRVRVHRRRPPIVVVYRCTLSRNFVRELIQ